MHLLSAFLGHNTDLRSRGTTSLPLSSRTRPSPPLPSALWLSQDRIYAAHAYPRFIGALISRIPFHLDDPIDGAKERFHNSVLPALVSCLDNIVLEVDFFKKTAAEFGLEMEGWVERKGTKMILQSSRAAVEKFATNWSTPEFGNFVEMLGGLVDSLGVGFLGQDGGDLDEGR
jgi:hypothetical protein